MERTLRDIIYPTIKKKFNELTIRYDDNTYYFYDKNNKAKIAYNIQIHFLAISIKAFMLHYFGMDVDIEEEDVDNLFIELIQDKLGKKIVIDKISYV
jgi:hypothetical protein